MGFWGGLGKVLGAAGSIASIPFTGGSSLAWLPPVLGAGGAIAGGMAGGRAAGRSQEAQMGNQADLVRLGAARLNLEAPQQRAQNSVRGDILAGLQPMSINGPITHTGGQMPQVSGGLSPALLSQNSRQLGQQMSRQALMSQMQGDFQPTPQPKAGTLDHILNGIGYAGLGADVLSQIPRRPPAPTIDVPPIASNRVQWPTFGG